MLFIKKNTLEDDIRIILKARNIIFSIGTFIPALMLLSNNIQYIYGYFTKNFKDLDDIYKMFLPIENTDLTCFSGLEEYYKIMKPWKNTIAQRNYILTYDYN